MTRRFRTAGFTLVELLIVIIIVGILAAVAIPQFGNSSRDARLATLDANLSVVRNAIELYYHQHTDTYPGATGTTTNHDGVAHSDAAQAFLMQLTMYSDASGNTSSTKDADTFPYGPYLKFQFPSNPLAVSAATDPTSVTVGSEATQITAEASPTTGWRFSFATGQFIANNTDYDDR